MSEENRVCRCLLMQTGKEEIFRDINERISKLRPEEKCSDEKYAGRLEKCRECDSLENGTCLKCGCYPEFRAAFRKNHCPANKW